MNTRSLTLALAALAGCVFASENGTLEKPFTSTTTLQLQDKEATATTSTALSTCNPLKTTGCPADKALATSISNDFKSDNSHYVPYRTPNEIHYADDGLSLVLAKRFDNPSLVSDFYIMFGKIEVWLKSASGQGIISSFYLQSDDLDEIDMEWFGGDASQMQSNFFSKGDTTTYDRGGYHDMADPREDFHNYTMDWTPDALTWYIDGNAVRTLESNDPSGYPQSPMRLFFGIWAGGDPTNAEGTIQWAGGATDYSQAPFSMHIQSLVVSDYSSGSEYSYSDNTGSWQSIKAKDGKVMGRQAIADEEFSSLVSGDNSGSAVSSIASSNKQVSTKAQTTKSATAASVVTTTSSTSEHTKESTKDQTSRVPTTLTTSTTTKAEKTSSSSSESSTLKTVTTHNGGGDIIFQASSMTGLATFMVVLLSLI